MLRRHRCKAGLLNLSPGHGVTAELAQCPGGFEEMLIRFSETSDPSRSHGAQGQAEKRTWTSSCPRNQNAPRARARARNRGTERSRNLDAGPFRRRTARCPGAMVLKPVVSTPELPGGRPGAATSVPAHVFPPVKAPPTQRVGRRGNPRSPTLGRWRLRGAL